MSDIAPVPGRIVALVVGDPEAGAATAAALRALDLPDATVASVDTLRGSLDERPWGTGQAPDYLLLARAGGPVDVDTVVAALRLLRTDASTGLVGRSPAGHASGELALFVALDLCLVRPDVLDVAGGLDPTGGPLAALDLGWRAWLTGWRVRSAGPAPVAVDEPASITADAVRPLLATVLGEASLQAAPDALEPAAVQRRAALQARRRRGDGELLPFAHREVEAWAQVDPAAAAVIDGLQRWGAPDRSGPRRRIAVVTADTLAPRMAGPGIRARAIAQRLATEHDVVLATTGRCDLEGEGFEVRAVGERGLKELERWCDVFVFQGWVMAGRPYLRDSDKVLVADLYDPMHLEQLEHGRTERGERGWFDSVRNVTAVLNEQLLRADFLLCASAKQRDLWLGQLAGLGRLTPVLYDGDESLDGLLAIAPFGVGDEPPVRTRSAIRGTIPGIGPDDQVVLWGGGIYNWFDPLTLVRAIDEVRVDVPGARLVFLGLRHPNPDVPEMEMAVATRRLAEELGLVGKHVFFNEDWIEFDDRQNFLLDADIGVSTHLHHVETEFSFRTRILDYLWAGLPILATDGDGFAELIRREGLGEVVPPGDVAAVADGLRRLLTDREVADACRARVAQVAPGLRWSQALEPLAAFCRSPRRAADVACPRLDPHAGADPLGRGWRHDLGTARALLQAGGLRLVWSRASGRLRRQRR